MTLDQAVEIGKLTKKCVVYDGIPLSEDELDTLKRHSKTDLIQKIYRVAADELQIYQEYLLNKYPQSIDALPRFNAYCAGQTKILDYVTNVIKQID